MFAGYPIADYLLNFVRDFQSLEITTRQRTSAALEKLNNAKEQFTRHTVRDPSGHANLEELLTYLELYRGTTFALNPWEASDSDGIRLLITKKFLHYQYDLNKIVWESGVPIGPVAANPHLACKVSEAWASKVRPGDVIVTFNWDILHEVILWRYDLWSYRDGYGFSCGSQGHKEKPTRVLMLKLHGSVNWVQGNDRNPVSEIANIPDFFVDSKDWDRREHYNQAQVDLGRKLVLPTYLKDISSNRSLLDTWTKAHKLIAQAKELFVIGYSLNPVDHPARLLFGTALSENATLNHVTVVSPEITEWGRFLDNLNKKVVSIRQKFEDWVCAET